jgi:hypothetical protein
MSLQVRIATYTQTVCNILLLGVASDADRTSSTYRALILTSLATVLTLGIFSLRTELSLHHSVVASSLLTITIVPAHILESWRVRSPGLFVAQQIRLAIYCAYGWWLVLQMPCMGAEPQCNLCTRTSFFGYASRVTTDKSRSIRLAIILVTSYFWLRSVVWFYGLRHFFEAFPALFSETRKQAWNSYIDRTHDELMKWRVQSLSRARQKNPPMRSMILFRLWYDDDATAREGIEQRRWQQTQFRDLGQISWIGRVWGDAMLAIRVPRCQRAIAVLLLTALLIFNTEQTVKLNLTAAGNKWGYGQIFALVATVPSVADTIKLLLRLGKKRE